ALLAAQLEQRLDLGEALLEPVEDLEVVTYASELGRDLARLVLVVPQVRPARFFLELSQPGPRCVDLEISAGVVDAAAELGQRFGEVAHHEGCGYECRGSATVAVLELLAAPAVARLVATGRPLDVHRLLHDVFRSLGHRSGGRGARAVSHAVSHTVAHRLLERLPG